LARALQLSAELASAAEPFTQIYESLRTIAPATHERTIALDALVRMVEEQAQQGQWSPADARTLFASGEEGARVFALAMMRAFPRAQELDLAEEAATEPLSSFEQFHALVVIHRMVGQLSAPQRVRLAPQLEGLDLPPAGARARAREAIMEKIGFPTAHGRKPGAD
jgi:hypothetical protein